jgi:hypothetical protein
MKKLKDSETRDLIIRWPMDAFGGRFGVIRPMDRAQARAGNLYNFWKVKLGMFRFISTPKNVKRRKKMAGKTTVASPRPWLCLRSGRDSLRCDRRAHPSSRALLASSSPPPVANPPHLAPKVRSHPVRPAPSSPPRRVPPSLPPPPRGSGALPAVRRRRPVRPLLSAIGATAIDVLPPRRCGPRRSRRPCPRSTGAPSPAPIRSSAPATRAVRSTSPRQEMPVLHAVGHSPKMVAAPTAHRPRLRYSSSPSSSTPRPQRVGITPIHRALR